jgi:hypothetical protein
VSTHRDLLLWHRGSSRYFFAAALGVPVPELPRIAALAGSEAVARARKLETLIVTSAYRFNRLSFRPLTTAAMCPTGQRAGRIWPADVGQPPPIFSQQTRRGNERTKKTKG